MDRREFDAWIETHYTDLLARARAMEATNPRDAVHTTVARALDSSTFAALDGDKTWPWLVDSLRGTIQSDRRGARRAKRAQRKLSGSFSNERTERGKHNRVPIPALHEPLADEDAGRFVGPKGWHGEYTIAHVGKCRCGGEQFSRAEVGRDTDRRTGNKALARRLLDDLVDAVKHKPVDGIERLAAFALGCVVTEAAPIRQQWHAYQVLGCWMGHRVYTGALPLMGSRR